MNMKPLYPAPDCRHCTYLGPFQVDGEKFDLYVHEHQGQPVSVMALGADSESYGAVDLEAADPDYVPEGKALAEAAARARILF